MSAHIVLMIVVLTIGNGPRSESGEVEINALDLRGKWEGVWMDNPTGDTSPIGYKNGMIYMPGGHFASEIIDDGEGCLHFTKGWAGNIGIYHQYKSHLIICYCNRRYGRPTSFRIGDGVHQLLILHRVKQDK